MDNEEEEEAVVTSWSSIWVTLLISAAQGIFFYGFFLYQRRKEIAKECYDLYEPRQHTRKHRSPPPFEKSWWKAALAVTQEETLRCIGLDSYMFLRFLRLGVRICAIGVALSVILMPVYATGDARGNETEKFNMLTLARVDENSNRIWAALIAWWFFVAFILHEFWREWKLYAFNRYEFLARGDVDMPNEYRYAIRVEQIPSKYRSDEALKEYFERLFPDRVQQATAYLETESLQKLIDERQAIILKLESAIAFTKAKPMKPRPLVKKDAKMGCCGGVKVDAIEYYEKEIERLNEEIDIQRGQFKSISDAEKTELPAVDSEGEQDDMIEVSYTSKAKEEVKVYSEDTGPKVSSTGFVTFTSLRAKQAAVQCELTGDPDRMVVVPAPDPKGILWGNVTVPLSRQKIFQFQAALLWTAGILFWAVPVSFVVGISNLNSILEAFGLNSANPDAFWYGLVCGLLPVIALAVLMIVLYMAIVAVATKLVRFKSMPEVDSYSLFWHQLFQFANLWLILISGSLFNQIDVLIDDITSFVDTIVAAIPGASVFFVLMILLKSFGAFGLELSMLPTHGIKLIMNIIQPEAMRTQRQLDEGKKPPSIIWGKQIPPVVFIFLVSIMYMPIVPIMELFALFYFMGMYLVWKHQCLHVYAQEFEGGGEATWQKLFGFLMASLYMGEIVFIAYMGLKKALAQFILAFFPFVGTVITHQLLNRNIIKPLENLSLEVAANIDIEDGELTKEDGGGKLYAMPSLDASQEERGPMSYRREAWEQKIGIVVTSEDPAESLAEKGASVGDSMGKYASAVEDSMEKDASAMGESLEKDATAAEREITNVSSF